MAETSFKKGIDYTGVGIAFISHDGAGNFFMNKRGENARDEKGVWEFGGGALELNDTVEETLRREVREEYDTEVLDFKFLGYRDVHREHEGVKTHWLMLDFKVHIDREHAKNGEPNKFDDAGWFTLNALPEPLHSQMEDTLRLYKNKLLS